MQWHHSSFPYLYDTHVHTRQGSACGKNTGSEMALAYHAAGYSGIIITDHFYYGNTAVDRSLPWTEWVNTFCLGYEDAYETGQKIGLDVFFGWEACYHGTEFLIYGLNKDWLLQHPEIKDASISEQYELVHTSGGLVIQAHPYREESYIDEIRLVPDLVDGIEVLNACHTNPNSPAHFNPYFDKQAALYAKTHNFIVTAGSDMHQTKLLGGGMAFTKRLSDSHDFISSIRAQKGILLTNGAYHLLVKDYLSILEKD